MQFLSYDDNKMTPSVTFSLDFDTTSHSYSSNTKEFTFVKITQIPFSLCTSIKTHISKITHAHLTLGSSV
jgi:hypothetical protein